MCTQYKQYDTIANMETILQPLHNVFHAPHTKIYAIVQWITWWLVVLSIITFGISVYFPTEHPYSYTIAWIDSILIWLFTVEYVLRIISFRPKVLNVLHVSKRKALEIHIYRRILYSLRPLNLIDLITILGNVPALRALRILRVLRLLRVIKDSKMFKYSNPFYSLIDAYEKNELLYIFGFSVIFICNLLGGITLYLAEVSINENIKDLGDAMWWSMVTLTTVGYGDIYPVTMVGRIIGSGLMISGLFILALFAGIVGQTMLSSVLSLREEQFRMSNTIQHIVVCGYTQHSRVLLDTLLEEFDFNQYKPIIFAPYERPTDIPLDFEWINGDPAKENELDKVRLLYADSCLIVSDPQMDPQTADARTILIVFTIRSYLSKTPLYKQRKTPLYIAAEILESENIAYAKTAGANEVIASTRLGYSMMSHAVAQKGTASIVNSLISARDNNVYLSSTIPNYPYPKTFAEISVDLRRCYGVLVIGVKTENTEEINPANSFVVIAAHQIIYLADAPINTPYTPT